MDVYPQLRVSETTIPNAGYKKRIDGRTIEQMLQWSEVELQL